MDKQSNNKKIFHGWIVVLECVLIMSMGVGIVSNCQGLFIKPICEDLGFGRQEYGITQTILSLGTTVLAIFAGPMYKRFRLKDIMRAGVIALLIFYTTFSFSTTLPIFYISYVGLSFAASVLGVLPNSFIVNNWFKTNKGRAMGVAFMGAGLGASLFNFLGGRWITAFGWRITQRIIVVLMAVTLIPCVFFTLKYSPEEMGLQPYSEKERSTKKKHFTFVRGDGYSFAEVRKVPTFWVICFCTIFIRLSANALNINMASQVSDAGYALTIASAITAITMALMAANKPIMGQLFDRAGVQWTVLVVCISGIIGFTGMLNCRNPVFLALMVLGAPMACSFGSAGLPILTITLFGEKDNKTIQGILTACGNIGVAMISLISGGVYDATGSYDLAIYLFIFLMLLAGIGYEVSFAVMRHKIKKHDQEAFQAQA